MIFAQMQSVELRVPPVDLLAIGPETALAVAGIIVVLLASFRHRFGGLGALPSVVGLGGAVVAFLLCLRLWSVIGEDGAYQAIAGMVAVDRFAVLARVAILVACSLSILISEGYARREGFDRPEYVALLLLSSSGMLLMTSANDLVMVFLALEVLSIALYVLSAFDRRRRESEEAGIKYFVLGAFSSAVLLYGIALVYGATGTTSLPGIASFLARTVVLEDGLLLAGLALLFVGLGFKVAVVPFHTWTPDVYQGAPSPVTGFMAAGAKAAGFAALIRVLVGAFEAYRLDWELPVQIIAVATLLVGSVLAVVQEDVKRMLAYSSISHAGYVLIGVVVAGGAGIAAALFYLLSYAFLVIGSFAVVSVVAGRGDARHRLSDYRGLGKRRPALAAALTLFLLAQAGVPLTSGFVAKFT
ncbi:MAG: NADH-quinone oxidoreductase subunit N, partial [Acidimicrobiia bacterium]